MRFRYSILTVVIVGFLVYGNALLNGFVWDDVELFIKNPQLHSLRFLPDIFAGSTFNSGGGGSLPGLYYKPLMMASFTFLYSLSGPNAAFFHLFQITFHIVSAILVYLLLKKLLKRDKISFVLALIFLVHPMNVETVVYSAALQDVLFFFFGALALLVESPVLAAGFLLLSLLSKETGVVAAVIVFLRFLMFGRRKIIRFLPSMVVAVSIYAYLRFAVAHIFFNKHGVATLSTMPVAERILNIPAIFFFYLKTFFWPVNLAIDQQWATRTVNWQDFWLPLIADAVFVLIVSLPLMWFWRSKSHWFKTYLFFFLWFWLALGFHLQIFPLDLTVSDRWFYLPMVGLLGIIGSVISSYQSFWQTSRRVRPESPRNAEEVRSWTSQDDGINEMTVLENVRQPATLGLIVFILFLLSFRTIVRTFDWRNGLTLYGHDLQISRDSYDLENNYGAELFWKGKYDEAAVHFNNSIKLAPNWWTNYNNLGSYYQLKGDLAQAEKLYKKSIDNGQYYLAYENYGFILLKEKKYGEAVTFLEKSIPLLPQNPQLVSALAIAYYQNGNRDKAMKVAEYLIKLSPTDENELFFKKMENSQQILP